jgi:hypothetical protein
MPFQHAAMTCGPDITGGRDLYRAPAAAKCSSFSKTNESPLRSQPLVIDLLVG